MSRRARYGFLAVTLLAAGALILVAGFGGQISLAPIDPARAVSVEHQVRQDMAIEALEARETEHERQDQARLDRLERLEDAIVGLLLASLAGQWWAHRRTSGLHRDVSELTQRPRPDVPPRPSLQRRKDRYDRLGS